jgi:hypothetical protein
MQPNEKSCHGVKGGFCFLQVVFGVESQLWTVYVETFTPIVGEYLLA